MKGATQMAGSKPDSRIERVAHPRLVAVVDLNVAKLRGVGFEGREVGEDAIGADVFEIGIP
jgi:hypothetical protein